MRFGLSTRIAAYIEVALMWPLCLLPGKSIYRIDTLAMFRACAAIVEVFNVSRKPNQFMLYMIAVNLTLGAGDATGYYILFRFHGQTRAELLEAIIIESFTQEELKRMLAKL